MDSKFILIQNFLWTQDFCGPKKFLGSNFFSGPKFLDPNLLWTQFFFSQHFFYLKFLQPKFFSIKKYFWHLKPSLVRILPKLNTYFTCFPKGGYHLNIESTTMMFFGNVISLFVQKILPWSLRLGGNHMDFTG